MKYIFSFAALTLLPIQFYGQNISTSHFLKTGECIELSASELLNEECCFAWFNSEYVLLSNEHTLEVCAAEDTEYSLIITDGITKKQTINFEIITCDLIFETNPYFPAICEGASIEISYSANQNIKTIQWYDQNQKLLPFNASQYIITLDEIGYYTAEIELENGCQFSEVIYVSEQVMEAEICNNFLDDDCDGLIDCDDAEDCETITLKNNIIDCSCNFFIETSSTTCDCCENLEVNSTDPGYDPNNFSFSWKVNNIDLIDDGNSEWLACENGKYFVQIENENTNCEITQTVIIRPRKSEKYELVVTGSKTNHSITIKQNSLSINKIIYGNTCDNSTLSLELKEGESWLCSEETSYLFNGVEINNLNGLRSNQEGELIVKYCGKEILKIEKKTYSDNPTISFKGGFQLGHPTYDGEYGWDYPNHSNLKGRRQDYDNIQINGSSYWVPWLIMIPQNIAQIEYIIELKNHHKKDPNFFILARASSTNSRNSFLIEDEQGESHLTNDFFKSKNSIKIECNYAGGYRNPKDPANRAQSLEFFDGCNNLAGQINLLYSTTKKMNIHWIDVNVDRMQQPPLNREDVLQFVNNNSQNQLFIEWSFDVPDAEWSEVINISREEYRLFREDLRLADEGSLETLFEMYFRHNPTLNKPPRFTVPFIFNTNIPARVGSIHTEAFTLSTSHGIGIGIMLLRGSDERAVGHELGHYVGLNHPWEDDLNIPEGSSEGNYMDYPPTKYPKMYFYIKHIKEAIRPD